MTKKQMPREAIICGRCEANRMLWETDKAYHLLAELEEIVSTKQDNIGTMGEPKRRTIIYMCGECGGVYGRVETRDHGNITLSEFCKYAGALDVNAILKRAPKEKGFFTD